jgi:protein phosphatase 1D
MKGGISLRNIPLDTRSFHTFGRLDNCHIVMAHPTTSRYHAVLQYRSTFSNEDEKKGFYLYDLGSTHGTFLNKYRIKPKTYVKVQVSVFSSSRFCGSVEPCNNARGDSFRLDT